MYNIIYTYIYICTQTRYILIWTYISIYARYLHSLFRTPWYPHDILRRVSRAVASEPYTLRVRGRVRPPTGFRQGGFNHEDDDISWRNRGKHRHIYIYIHLYIYVNSSTYVYYIYITNDNLDVSVKMADWSPKWPLCDLTVADVTIEDGAPFHPMNLQHQTHLKTNPSTPGLDFSFSW